MLATAMTNETTVVAANMRGVAATRTPTRKTTRARSVYSGDLRAVAVSEARPRTEAARSRPERAARPVTAGAPGAAPDPATAGVRPERRGPSRPRRGRADHDAAVGVDPDRFGL